ncbi:MAG: methane monooxygenase/ammonia monooxygenase subunit B [Magnetococcus sp. YQC-5]
MSSDSEVEKAHREPADHEKKARDKKLAAGKFTDGGSLSEAKEGEADLYSRPVLSGRDEVSVDQLAMVDMDTGEKRIKARLINHGHQKLTAAQVNIEFLNSSGQVVLSRAVNPLVVSGGIFGDQSEALAPGSSRPFYVLADDAPAGWSGKLGAKVMGFWFGSHDDGEEVR